jgi:hypothetical protein
MGDAVALLEAPVSINRFGALASPRARPKSILVRVAGLICAMT